MGKRPIGIPGKRAEGKAYSQIQPAIRALRTYAGRYLHTVNGRKIYDLGQNLSGMLHIRLKGRAGEAIRVYPAEKLDAAGDAVQMAKNWLEIDSRMTCIPAKDGEWRTSIPYLPTSPGGIWPLREMRKWRRYPRRRFPAQERTTASSGVTTTGI